MIRPRSLTTLASDRTPVGEIGAKSGVQPAVATCQILVTNPEFWVAIAAANWQPVAAAHQERSKVQGRLVRVDQS